MKTTLLKPFPVISTGKWSSSFIGAINYSGNCLEAWSSWADVKNNWRSVIPFFGSNPRLFLLRQISYRAISVSSFIEFCQLPRHVISEVEDTLHMYGKVAYENLGWVSYTWSCGGLSQRHVFIILSQEPLLSSCMVMHCSIWVWIDHPDIAINKGVSKIFVDILPAANLIWTILPINLRKISVPETGMKKKLQSST